MLSRGKWHLKVPRKPAENVRWRRRLYRKMLADRRFAEAVKEVCRRDFFFYVNAFVWQFNPRKSGRQAGPFCTWEFQERAARKILDAIEQQHDLVIEKSREMGASWLCLLVFEWLWHFHPWQKFLCISRSADAVEDDDPDSLFWKIDFVHRYLPVSLMPRVKRRKFFYGNLDTHSTITGQASTGRAGVGGRATAMLVDEFSQIKEDSEVQDRTSDTTGCRIFNGTHVGVGTAFFRLTVGGMRKLQMHWTEHPDKRRGLYQWNAGTNQVEVLDKSFHFGADFSFVLDGGPRGGLHPGVRSPWYDEQCTRKTSTRAIAMDLDIDPQGSVSQFFNPLTIRRLVHRDAIEPVWEGELHFDRDTAEPVALVEKPGGNLRLWVSPDKDGRVPAGRYAAGADVATGAGSTPSCVSVVNGLGEKVAEYANAHVAADEFARLAVSLCRLFATRGGEGAMFAWECPGPGLLVTKAVLELGYANVYYRTDDYDAKHERSDKPGWYSSVSTKTPLLEEYRTAIETFQFVNRSERALLETLAFSYTPRGTVEHGAEATGNDDPTAARVNHGDMVIADALAWKMVAEFVRAHPEVERKPEPTVASVAGRRKWNAELRRQTSGVWQ